MATTLKPGQDVVCTVTKAPRSASAVATLERLMRLDPANRKALRRAQRMRRQRLVVYNRGNRDWVSREKPARVVQVRPGAKFTLPFTLDLQADLKSVEKYVSMQ